MERRKAFSGNFRFFPANRKKMGGRVFKGDVNRCKVLISKCVQGTERSSPLLEYEVQEGSGKGQGLHRFLVPGHERHYVLLRILNLVLREM